MARPQPGDTWVPRGCVQLVERWARGQLPRERVLAAAGADQEDPHLRDSTSTLGGFERTTCGASGGAMQEPGLDRHEWESELQALEPELEDDPLGALPEL